jgi:hypothetical protein
MIMPTAGSGSESMVGRFRLTGKRTANESHDSCHP